MSHYVVCMYMYVCMNVVYLYVTYVFSESITTHHISQIISGAVPGKYLQANMDSLVKVILFVFLKLQYGSFY